MSGVWDRAKQRLQVAAWRVRGGEERHRKSQRREKADSAGGSCDKDYEAQA